MFRDKSVSIRNKVLVIGITVIAVVVIFGVGYAFFSVSSSNTNHETVNTQTATLSLKFDDNDNGISANLNLGESITKTFTLENTGTKDAYAKINWYNLVNTYTQNSLSYTLEQSDEENGTYIKIGTGKVPTSSTELTKVLKNGILVPVSTKYYYKLTITLNNLNINQNSDINASMHSYFNLEEGSLTGVDKLLQLVQGADENSIDVITKEAPSGSTCTNTLAYDGTIDNNLRYVGANPCNYVTFNNELWRIIGVMTGIDDGTGNKETRIKLIRNDSLGNYSWDTSSFNIYYGYGVNDWTQADLMQELNGDYLDTTLTSNTMWYNGSSNQKTGVFDYTKRLSTEAQEMIGNAKWQLGGQEHSVCQVLGECTASKFYGYERGTKVWGSKLGQTCNDGACPRALDWTGKVALIYPSDYGFTVGGEVRSVCFGKNLGEYGDYNCSTNNWIHLNTTQWLLSPFSDYPYFVVGIYSNDTISYLRTDNYISTHPSIYLKSNIKITGGNGSIESPYTLD